METEIREAARDVLRTFGPLTPAELQRQLRIEDPEIDELSTSDLAALLLDDEPGEFAAFPLVDGRWCDLDHLLDGLVLTHMIDDHERDSGRLHLEPDLDAVLLLEVDGTRGIPLAAGGEATVVYGDEDTHLVGPDGWLPDTPAVALRITEAGLELSGMDAVPPATPLTVQRLRQTFEGVRAMELGLDVPLLVMETRARYPGWLSTPDAPFGELLAEADLRLTERGIFDVNDPEADDLAASQTEELVEHLHHDHGFDDHEVGTVLRFERRILELSNRFLRDALDAARATDLADIEPDPVGAARSAVEAGDPAPLDELAEELGELCDDERLTLVAVKDVIGLDAVSAGIAHGLLDACATAPALRPRRRRANAAWLRAELLERTAEDHTEVERELRRAVELDPNHAQATYDLAHYLSDRGQAGAALRLLTRLQDVDDEAALLRPYAAPGPVSAGRNDPCPCGSGRKHKVCCGVRNGWPLAERMDWLWQKIVAFLVSPAGAEVSRPVAAAAGVPNDARLLDNVALLNAVLFEGGGLRRMCDRRGGLLPADELELLRRWQDATACCYELVETSGQQLTLLDLRTGDRVQITDHSLSRQLGPGDALLGWIVPHPEVPTAAGGGVAVPDHRRKDLLDLLDTGPDGAELAAWFASLSAPPRLSTTAGDPLVSCELTYRVSDGSAARRTLADHLEDDGEALQAFEERDGRRWLRGTVTIDGNTLTVTTMSTPRAAWFRDLIAEALPDAELVDEVRLPASDLHGLAGDREHTDGPDDGLLDLDDLPEDERAELEAQLVAMIEQHEDAWVDTPLPALDGATPRDAADDPTLRPQLERILDEFAAHARTWTSPGRAMDADRLRRLLDLR